MRSGKGLLLKITILAEGPDSPVSNHALLADVAEGRDNDLKGTIHHTIEEKNKIKCINRSGFLLSSDLLDWRFPLSVYRDIWLRTERV